MKSASALIVSEPRWCQHPSGPEPSTEQAITLEIEQPSAASSAGLVGRLCLAALAITAKAGLTHGSVSLSHQADLANLVFASDEAARQLAELQTTLGEGPTLLAVGEQRPVLIADLATDPLSRLWVLFASDASALGIGSIYAFPLQVGAIGLGVLTLHGQGPVALDYEQTSDLLRIRDKLALALLTPDGELEDPAGWADAANYAHVNQAAGMVMVQLDCSLAEAFVQLRGHALGTGQTISAVASAIVDRRLRLDRLSLGPARDNGTERRDER